MLAALQAASAKSVHAHGHERWACVWAGGRQRQRAVEREGADAGCARSIVVCRERLRWPSVGCVDVASHISGCAGQWSVSLDRNDVWHGWLPSGTIMPESDAARSALHVPCGSLALHVVSFM